MDLLNSLATSLLTPMVLAFFLGILATLVKSDFEFPKDLTSALTIYLLFAIGLRGGAKLSGVALGDIALPVLAAVSLGTIIPIWSWWMLRNIGKMDHANAAAVAAHYGSVSVVTFSAGLAFLEAKSIPVEPYLPAMLAILEVPGILMAILVYRKFGKTGGNSGSLGKLLHEMLSGKGIVLLLGGMAIGLLSGKNGVEQVAPLFDAPFKGVLCLFLLEIGLTTGKRLGDLRHAGVFLAAFAFVMPVVHGFLGVWLGHLTGLSLGGSTILGVLSASASYIAAPAAVRLAIPEASPTYYLTASLAITFPFNIALGIPLYYSFAKMFAA